jgi:hypothetical protein
LEALSRNGHEPDLAEQILVAPLVVVDGVTKTYPRVRALEKVEKAYLK